MTLIVVLTVKKISNVIVYHHCGESRVLSLQCLVVVGSMVLRCFTRFMVKAQGYASKPGLNHQLTVKQFTKQISWIKRIH